MKIGIITFHRAINYGAVLQAFALYQTLKKLNYDPCIIDYIAPSVSSLHHKIKLKLDLKSIYYYFRYGKSINKRYDKFIEFIKTVKLTEPVNNEKEICSLCDGLDAVICGSDQVWNVKITEKDYNFFLCSVPDSKKKIAYAASFGLSEFKDDDIKSIIPLLNRLNNISVRETTGQTIVKNICGKVPQLVLDPTLLLSKEEWTNLCQSFETPDKYILIYSVGDIEDLFPIALEIQKKHKLKIAVIAHKKFRQLSDAIYFKDLGPLEFVQLFNNATYVVTNSFHGTAFSVVLQKKFIIKLRNEKDNPGLNSRMLTLLESIGLEKQVYVDGADANKMLEVDFSEANYNLNQLRASSISYLEEALS